MKKYGLIILILFVAQACPAQTWAEWTQQKKTQIKYLMKQIAALQVYIGYAKKGYDIANKGLTTIGNIKNGEFNLHRDFFGALRTVNPRIKNYARVADIIALQIQIIQTYQRSYRRIRESNQFTAGETDHIHNLFTRLLDATVSNMEELITVISSNQYEMKDDERLKRIDHLYTDMEVKYGMVRQLGSENLILAMQLMKEQNDVEVMKKLYHLQNP